MCDVREPDDLDWLIKEITVDSHDDDEQLEAFRQAFEETVAFPCDVGGERPAGMEQQVGQSCALLLARARPEGAARVQGSAGVAFPPCGRVSESPPAPPTV
jgi:hypothetical protein